MNFGKSSFVRRGRVAVAVLLLLGAAAVAVTSGSGVRAQVADPAGAALYFPASGHSLHEPLQTFFRQTGGAARYGVPLTEQFADGPVFYQVFERGALRLDSATHAVAVRPLGSEWIMEHLGTPPAREAAPQIIGGFKEIYDALGGAASFGAALTDEVPENGLTVQYFEAGKLSYSLTRAPGPLVQVDAIGREWLAIHQVPAAALNKVAPPATATSTVAASPTNPPTVPPTASPTVVARESPTATVVLSPTAVPSPTASPTPVLVVPAGWNLVATGVTTFKGSSAARTHNLSLAARKLDGTVIAAGSVFSFNRTLGDDTERAGFVKGLIIYNGRTIEGVGGGICQVASTFFRAAFNSGFDIVERHPHSYRVSWYEPPVGVDATVFSDEGVDLRFRNNLSAPALLRTVIDQQNGTLAVLVYSKAAQPFTVSMDGPYTSNRVPHGAPLYENDATLAAGTIKQVEHAKDGLDVKVYRVLTDRKTGQVIRRETFFSHYVPWRDIFKRGTSKHGTTSNGSSVSVQKP